MTTVNDVALIARRRRAGNEVWSSSCSPRLRLDAQLPQSLANLPIGLGRWDTDCRDALGVSAEVLASSAGNPISERYHFLVSNLAAATGGNPPGATKCASDI